jgi:hypothetical protein
MYKGCAGRYHRSISFHMELNFFLASSCQVPMRKLFLFLPLPLALLVMDPLQAFGSTTATMQVSFLVLESCSVSEIGIAVPDVKCLQDGNFIVKAAPAVPATKVAPKETAGESNSTDGWIVYF